MKKVREFKASASKPTVPLSGNIVVSCAGDNILDSPVSSSGEANHARRHPSTDVLRGLFVGFWPRVERRIVVSLTVNAYCDASGGTHPSRVVTMGGCLIDIDYVDVFNAAWQECMADWGLPYFHMTDCQGERGAYAAWSEAVRDKRIRRLLDVIANSPMGLFGMAVGKKEFNTVMSPEAQKGCGGTYGYLGAACIEQVDYAWDWLFRIYEDTGQSVKVNFIIEDDTKGYGRIKDAFDRAKRGNKRLGVISQMTKLDAPIIQVPDIVAWELAHEYPRAAWKRPTLQREPMGLLTRNVHRFEYATGGFLRDANRKYERLSEPGNAVVHEGASDNEQRHEPE